MTESLLRSVEPECVHLDPGTNVPNHPDLPVLLYRRIFRDAPDDVAGFYESTFRENGWSGCWRNGIFSYHHFHTTTHEVLGVSRASARVRLGGSEGPALEVEDGDVLVLPAGTGHCLLGSEDRFQVVGAYPGGRDWDLERSYSGSLRDVHEALRRVPLPETDPIYGPDGPLCGEWS